MTEYKDIPGHIVSNCNHSTSSLVSPGHCTHKGQCTHFWGASMNYSKLQAASARLIRLTFQDFFISKNYSKCNSKFLKPPYQIFSHKNIGLVVGLFSNESCEHQKNKYHQMFCFLPLLFSSFHLLYPLSSFSFPVCCLKEEQRTEFIPFPD